MTLMECATDCGRSYQTLLRWVKGIPHKRKGLREIYVDPDDWKSFCSDHNIIRKEDFK